MSGSPDNRPIFQRKAARRAHERSPCQLEFDAAFVRGCAYLGVPDRGSSSEHWLGRQSDAVRHGPAGSYGYYRRRISTRSGSPRRMGHVRLHGSRNFAWLSVACRLDVQPLNHRFLRGSRMPPQGQPEADVERLSRTG